MREIKFKVWDNQENRFLNWTREVKWSVVGTKKVDVDVDVVSAFGFLLEASRFTFNQFIGLQDKNGKDIYEGDVVRLFGDDEEVFEVTYDDYDDFPNPQFVLDAPDGRGDWFSKKDREVIGNIFENPELRCF